MKAKLITYTISKQPISAQNQLRKQLIGHNDTSHKGKYKYRRDGLLDKIPHLKPSRSTIIAPLNESKQIIRLLNKYNATIKTYDIQIKESKFNWSLQVIHFSRL